MTKKKYILLFGLALISLISIPAHAKFSIPDHVFNYSQIDDAQREAKSRNLPIALLLSDKNTTCSLCTSASNDIIYALKDVAVIVYIDNSTWMMLPQNIRTAFKSPQAGKYIPITLILDSNLEEIIYTLPYQRQNRILLINTAKEEIAKHVK